MRSAIKSFAAATLIAVACANNFAEGSQARELMKIKGHVSAVFTPTNSNGDLDVSLLPKLAARLHEWGVTNVMVGGTTGESTSFSTAERFEAVKAWLAIADTYKLNVYVHVGMESIQEARDYTKAVAALGQVKGIFCMPSVYFKPATIPNLVDTMAIIAGGAPDLPFWYYHIPVKTGVDFNMFQFVEEADKTAKIPNLMGVKFTCEILMDFNSAGHYKNKKYNMLFGRDEMLTSALATGVADGDVGSTVNYLTYNIRATNEWNAGNISSAQDLQMKTVDVIETWVKLLGSLNVQKSILKMTGIDFGPMRMPQINLSHDQEMELGTALAAIGVNITSEYISHPEDAGKYLQ